MYCMKCGQKMPEDSIFCQYCGNKIPKIVEEKDEYIEKAKTYVYDGEPTYKEDKTPFWRGVAIVFIIATILLVIYVSQLNNMIAEKTNEINTMKEEYTELEIELYNKQKEYDKINSSQESLKSLYIDAVTYKLFMDNHIAIVPNDGSKTYHKYKCDGYDSTLSFWAYNTEAAIGKGYKACDKCYAK